MSRTWKRFPRTMFRCPRGRKQALVAGVRRKAVPPDAWDDVSFDKQCWLPQRIANKLASDGWSILAIAKHLKKHKVPMSEMYWLLELAEYYRPKVPEGCLVIFDERKYEELHHV